ncbi:MAG: amidohydrolase family protein, partial [Clostridia bacterium]|nr:amidohydrolase family protein [Clostridia bacterium]
RTSILGEKTTGTPVLVEDGVAKLRDRSSFAGSVATMDVCFKTALRYGVPLPDAARSCALTPAEIAGVADKRGSLDVGKVADVLIFDSDFNLQSVFIKGKRIR